MAKAERTPEQIQAAKDRMAKVRAARQNKNPQTKKEATTAVLDQPKVEQPEIEQKDTIATEPSLTDLQRQIQELKDLNFTQLIKAIREGATPQEAMGNSSTAGGKLTGTFEKYVMDPSRYPDPSERIAEEPRLQRFAFSLNYELNYTVAVSEYTTIDNIRTREPKFNLELVRVIMDEETGEPTNGRYIICRFVMHEDPDAAIVIARDNGIDLPDQADEAAFLNEMRYIRMRDWVLECFYPAPVKKESSKREMVINNKLVTYYEKNNEEGLGVSQLDWEKLPRIKF